MQQASQAAKRPRLDGSSGIAPAPAGPPAAAAAGALARQTSSAGGSQSQPAGPSGPQEDSDADSDVEIQLLLGALQTAGGQGAQRQRQGPSLSRQLQLLLLKKYLLLCWERWLRSSFEGPLSTQHIQPVQLAAALAALRASRVPPPLPDPAEQHTFSVLSYNVWCAAGI